MYEKKKTLVKTAFEQAEKELRKENVSKNYLAGYLSTHFEGLFGSAKTDKMFERYYTDLVQKNKDRYIDGITLDQLSKYVGYKDYDDFCKNYTLTKTTGESTTVKVSINDDEESISEKFSKIFITVTNNPIFNIPEFLTKHSNLGIVGAILCGGLFVGNKMYKADKKKPEIETNRNRLGLLAATKQCMYWNGKEYVPEDCNQTKNNLIAIDPKKVANFKKITQPDTISSIKNIWYSKYQNEVEFFTDNGINPENGSDLRPLTYYILEKYTVREE
ncbi:hypothetical protein [Epilithonimonas zeae]|uniref:hypothetical protein n=1 Tax=Epilithonimonas zeae TaxID=1416779 RepID=UPI002010AC53|nr:hypothetical protein [Epilithonimonas zeae]UQB70304.1 hypothetical protein KI430_07735 [Epilithonimonas zeae]